MDRADDIRNVSWAGYHPSDTDELPGRTAASRSLTACGKRVHPGEAFARTARGSTEMDPLARRDSSGATRWWAIAELRESTGSE